MRDFTLNALSLLMMSRSKQKWRMEMSMHVTQALDQAPELRLLTDGELDEVSGGFLPVLVVGAWLAAGFVWGMVAGDYIAEQYYGG